MAFVQHLLQLYAQVMPYLEGVDLMTTLEFRGGCPYPELEACAIFNQIVDGLEVAHSLGLAHHDMSFENLMTDAAGDAVIIDWGMVVKVALTDRGIPVRLLVHFEHALHL